MTLPKPTLAVPIGQPPSSAVGGPAVPTPAQAVPHPDKPNSTEGFIITMASLCRRPILASVTPSLSTPSLFSPSRSTSRFTYPKCSAVDDRDRT
ncbi:hypothetical protein BC939DRAFT_436244 [Gamsiella multidivaricata]|uniref:uncharacterized protein n=1 Tax=Gamsiella multidivaricata TaxID=101098 RepID=UPI00221FF44A|nr:uncharacterized protein BC939DRAFT_436244 [Gamsiella multidivaricata]KAI7831719.1 hypothetical protein BC939DRAFT_436244 [Gamsiella multidivaricata]